MANDDIQISLESPELESPPEGQDPKAVGAIFSEDSMALMSAKLTMNESFLSLITRDYRFNEFVREILLTVMRVINSEAGSFLEVNHNEKQLFFRCAVGTASDRVTGFRIPVGQGVVGYVAESRRPYAVANTAENKIYLKSVGTAVGFEAKNLVAAPVIIRGKCFGVVELLNRVGEPNYTDSDIELLSYACEFAAKIIEARLMLSWVTKRNISRSSAA